MQNPTAIVTGASKGIGKAIARKLASLGYNLAMVARNEQQLEEFKNELHPFSGEYLALSADLSEEDVFEAIIKKTHAVFGRIDLLVNNAGLAHSASIAETGFETWDKIFRINARAPFFLCREAIPYLKKSPNPFIINIGSVVDFKGYALQAAYASSKHALAGFTKVLAKEVQEDGIRVHLISPGGVNTEMVSEMRPDIDVQQLIDPEEIAGIVEFIITQKGKGTIDHFYIRRQSGKPFD